MRIFERHGGLLLFSIIALLLCLSACSGKKAQQQQPEEEEETLACETNDDCENGWICLASECTDSSSKAIYTDPSHAVTPEKMRKHMEEAAETNNKRVNEALDM